MERRLRRCVRRQRQPIHEYLSRYKLEVWRTSAETTSDAHPADYHSQHRGSFKILAMAGKAKDEDGVNEGTIEIGGLGKVQGIKSANCLRGNAPGPTETERCSSDPEERGSGKTATGCLWWKLNKEDRIYTIITNRRRTAG